jgi:tetratricopeptide (TPR) repeat protein
VKTIVVRSALVLPCLWLAGMAKAGQSELPGAASEAMNAPYNTPGESSGAISISGKVMLDNGAAPSEMVLIERVCDGRAYPAAYSNSQGHFSFAFHRATGSFADSPEALSMGSRSAPRPEAGDQVRREVELDCEVRAALLGFRSDSISLLNHRYLDNPDIGTIVLHRLANVDGLTISATSALASKEARKAYEKGLEAMRRNKPDEAQKDFGRAVEGYPKYAAAWCGLARVYAQRDHLDQAREAYRRAIAADSKYIPPYEGLYMLAVKESKWKEVADTTDHVVSLDPFDFPNAYYFNAAANLQLNQLDVAEKNARRALELDTAHRNPKANYILGLILARKRDFVKSAEFLRIYLTAAPNDPYGNHIREELGRIESLVQQGK